ncbi:MAG: hypothetical protein ACLP50_08315 [Solirubrobacteraceae bacterium]
MAAQRPRSLKIDDPLDARATPPSPVAPKPPPEPNPTPARSSAKTNAAGHDTNGTVFARVPQALAQQLETTAKQLKSERITRAEIVAAALWQTLGPAATEPINELVARYRKR